MLGGKHRKLPAPPPSISSPHPEAHRRLVSAGVFDHGEIQVIDKDAEILLAAGGTGDAPAAVLQLRFHPTLDLT